jgi:tRNA (guanine-N7-)-methyltransferase
VTYVGADSWSVRPQLYGRGRGRGLRSGRRTLLAERLPSVELCLPVDGRTVEPRQLFAPTVSRVWLEIGFGSGEHLIGQALAHPDVGCIGCEPYLAGVAALLKEVERFGFANRVRVFTSDARLLLSRLADASIDRVFVLFADPWPKRRHHRRRLIQPETVEMLGRILRPGGELLFVTDDMSYLRWSLALLSDAGWFEWCARRPLDWRVAPIGWVETRYQAKAAARGAPCVYLRFWRRAQPREERNDAEKPCARAAAGYIAA